MKKVSRSFCCTLCLQAPYRKLGVQPVGTLNPYKRIEAVTAAWSEKCSITQNEKTGVFVSDTRVGGYIKLHAVNFGTTGPKSFATSLAAGLDGGIPEAYVDSPGGPTLATIQMPRTGGWQSWKTFAETVGTKVSGIHDVYFAFKGQNITAGRVLFNFDYWLFKN